MKVKYLIVRFSSIGDIVLTTPVVRCLKQQVENAEVHYLTKESYKGLLENNPYIDKIHTLKPSIKDTVADLKLEGFDYIIDLHNNLRTRRLKQKLKVVDFSVNKINKEKFLMVKFKKNILPKVHIVDRYMETVKLFDVSDDNKGLDYFIPENIEISKDFNLPKSYIALVIGGQHATKQLPNHKLQELCNEIDYPIVLLGGKEDAENGDLIAKGFSNVYNMCGKLSIHQSAQLVKDSVLVISHDTGLMHIAAAFSKDIISIWGNTIPEFGMTPFLSTDKSKVYEVNDLKCRPCSKIGFKKCPKKHFYCMENQNIKQISLYIKSLLN